MGSKRSSLAELEQLRRRGTKPDYPVVVTDDGIGAAWARKNKFFTVDRRDVGENLTAFAGLDVWIRTGKPFSESAEIAFALGEVARFVTITDSRGRALSLFMSTEPGMAA